MSDNCQHVYCLKVSQKTETEIDTCKRPAELMACDMTGMLTVGADSISTDRGDPKASLQSVVAGTVGMITGVQTGSQVISVVGCSNGSDVSAKATARGRGGAHHCTTTQFPESTGANSYVRDGRSNLGGTLNSNLNEKMSECGEHSCVKTVRVGNTDEDKFVHVKPVINELPGSLIAEQKEKNN